MTFENCVGYFLNNTHFIIGFAWARLMKTKKATEAVQKFKEILTTVDIYPNQLLADKGT